MVRVLACGDTALTLDFGGRVDTATSQRVLALDAGLSRAALPGVVEIVPALSSLTVHYDPLVTSADNIATAVSAMAGTLECRRDDAGPRRRWLLPACYHPDFAPDLDEIAARNGLARDTAVALHAEAAYRVLMIGFLPGHPYMGGLPPALELPRRATPRTAVPEGSIAIATTMCVIYPFVSPGGWNIVARTPARLFDAAREPASLLAPGDEVRFREIGRDEFDELYARARTGAWLPEPVTA